MSLASRQNRHNFWHFASLGICTGNAVISRLGSIYRLIGYNSFKSVENSNRVTIHGQNLLVVRLDSFSLPNYKSRFKNHPGCYFWREIKNCRFLMSADTGLWKENVLKSKCSASGFYYSGTYLILEPFMIVWQPVSHHHKPYKDVRLFTFTFTSISVCFTQRLKVCCIFNCFIPSSLLQSIFTTLALLPFL